ncbi:response regulator transcription factor [Opitutia bacterium ISCC 51]|nr:response regulator transcription factor [Opitutae bacterium ISCC 51]QXD30065.1 response regulator transcription factor [Opitutae bacterium ISCC 52]
MKRVVVIEDHTAVRQMICQLVESIPEFSMVGDAGDGQDAYTLCLEQKPDLVILDIMLPGLNGIEVLKRFSRHLRKTRVLVFSGYKNENLLKSCMLSGAHGFVEKSATLDALKDAMNIVSDGGTCFGEDNTRILEQALEEANSRRGNDVLTARERETLQLIAEGLSTRQIAEKMSISVKTAENHRTNMMRKLDLHNAAALTRYAVDMGMVENTPVFD